SSGREANPISNDHPPERAAPIALLKAALSVPVAASTDLAAEVGLRTWIARLRTDRVAIFPVSASQTSNAAAVIDLGVVGLAVIALVEVTLAEAASADSAAAVGAADGNYLGLECASNFQ